MSTLAQLVSLAISAAWVCQWATSGVSDSRAACASRHGLMDSTSMRWPSSTAASRCTCVRCCKSSMVLTRSANLTLTDASGSLDSGAPALAASRCQASASAMLSLPAPSNTPALSAHSAAIASWPLLRLSSSSFSFSGLAAPLSRLARSLYTSSISSGAGSVASHVRIRAVRSLDVAAEKAPPVNPSSGCASDLGVDLTTG